MDIQGESLQMNSSKRHGTFIRFKEPQEKMIVEILQRTGERKVDFFNRLVESEHSRIIKSPQTNEMIHENIGMLLDEIKEINSSIKTILDNSKASREGVNMIFPVTLFLMRELYRLTHFIINIFMKNGTVQPQHISRIISESNELARQSFNNFYHTVMNTPSKGIVDLLRKG